MSAELDRGKTAKAARILVVDDDEKIARMLYRGLTLAGYRVEVAYDGERAVGLLAAGGYDVLILDLLLPGPDGIDICSRLRAAGDSLPILVITARDQVADRVKGLDAGADDYLVKPFAYEELLARVRALLRRRSPHSGTLLRFADCSLDTVSREVRRDDERLEAFSPTEFELLALFMRHPRRILRREQILEQIWGSEFEGDANILDVYVGYVRRKMEAHSRSRLIHTVHGVGYVLRDD